MNQGYDYRQNWTPLSLGKLTLNITLSDDLRKDQKLVNSEILHSMILLKISVFETWLLLWQELMTHRLLTMVIILKFEPGSFQMQF